MTSAHSPAAVGVPKDLLLEDFKQQCTNLQGQYTRMHNRLQLLIGLSTALLPTLGAVALAASKGDVGRPWLILFPVAGLLLSAIDFITGSTGQDHATARRAGMARVLAQTQDCQHPQSAPAARPSAPIAGTLIERRLIRGCN